jgi:hypothetical protein
MTMRIPAGCRFSQNDGGAMYISDLNIQDLVELNAEGGLIRSPSRLPHLGPPGLLFPPCRSQNPLDFHLRS